MLIIRFARRGRKKQAFYDLVVAEKARSATKKFVAKLGYFNPITDAGAGEFKFDKDLVEKYISNGAQVSQSAARLLVKHDVKAAGKFIEERVTKPKKTEAPKEEPEAEEAPAEEAAPAEAAAAEEAPATEEAPAEEKAD